MTRCSGKRLSNLAERVDCKKRFLDSSLGFQYVCHGDFGEFGDLLRALEFDGSLSLELLDGGARDSVALGPKPCAAACARNWRMRATGLLAELGGSKAERSRFIGSSHMAMKNADVE